MFRIFAFSHFHILHGKKCENGKMLIFDQNFSFSHFRFFFSMEIVNMQKSANAKIGPNFCISAFSRLRIFSTEKNAKMGIFVNAKIQHDFRIFRIFSKEKCEKTNLRKCENDALFCIFKVSRFCTQKEIQFVPS